MEKFNFHLLGLFLLLLSCEAHTQAVDRKTQNCAEIERDIESSLRDWNLTTHVYIDCGDTLRLNLTYLQGSSVYLDQFSNELVVKTLVHKHRKSLTKWDAVNLTVQFEDFVDSVTFLLDDSEIKTIEELFANESFFDDIQYCFAEFTPSEIMLMNRTLAQYFVDSTKTEAPNFWGLLEGFSVFCQNGNRKHFQSSFDFILLIQFIKTVDPGDPYQVGFHERFYPLLDKYKIERSAIDMDMEDELIKYLESKVELN